MSELIVEIHVPIGQGDIAWIGEVEERVLFPLDDEPSGGVLYDDGEQLGDEYLLFVWQAPEAALLDIARRIAAEPGVPAGVYAVVTDTDSEEMGAGRRVEL